MLENSGTAHPDLPEIRHTTSAVLIRLPIRYSTHPRPLHIGSEQAPARSSPGKPGTSQKGLASKSVKYRGCLFVSSDLKPSSVSYFSFTLVDRDPGLFLTSLSSETLGNENFDVHWR
jgi:hypothetical protein